MDRRHFIMFGAMGAAGLLAAAIPLSGAAARPRHADAMAAAKARIGRLGDRLKASGWTDLAAKHQIAAEARVFAAHHRALARLEGWA